MAKKMFRSTTVLLALMIALMGLFAFALIGCESVDTDEDTKPTRVRAERVVFDDGAGKTYEMWISDIKTVYYEYEQGKRYRFGFTIYDKDNKPLDPDVLSSVYDPDSLTIEADKPGEHEIHIDIYGDGWDYAVLKVIVKEKPEPPRVKPEVSFDPKGAIDYVPNEKYVYKYDGGRHYPYMILSYNGYNIELTSSGIFTMENMEKSVDTKLRVGADIGVYIAYYAVGDMSIYNSYDRGKYENVSMSIIIEIVE